MKKILLVLALIVIGIIISQLTHQSDIDNKTPLTQPKASPLVTNSLLKSDVNNKKIPHIDT